MSVSECVVGFTVKYKLEIIKDTLIKYKQILVRRFCYYYPLSVFFSLFFLFAMGFVYLIFCLISVQSESIH